MPGPDAGLRLIFRDHLPQFMWTTIETGLASPGVADAHAVCPLDPPCPTCGSRGRPAWVEYKQTSGWAVTLEVEQIGWLMSYVRRGGSAYVAVRRHTAGGPRTPVADELWMMWAGQAGQIKKLGLRGVRDSLPHALLGVWAGGPSKWDWDEVAAILRR